MIDPEALAAEETPPPARPLAGQSAAAGARSGIATAVRSAVPNAIRDGGVVIRPSTGARVRWTPIEAVADEYDAAQAMRSRGYSCLGVIGNASHLRGSGGHTPWCSEGYAGRACKVGKVYAIDLEAPNMTGLERWLIPRLRAGSYKWVYYLNINGHQYTRKDSFRGRYSSADQHLHLSGLAGHENDNSSILRDYENFRTNGGEDMAQVPQAQWDRVRKQLDSIDDVVHGGNGAAYRESAMKRDHQSQVEQLKEYVDQRLNTIEAKLDALLGTTTPPPTA
ncbi:hypothetical protein [Cryptosporangium phraense]|uniref:Uncharacterized protein n=1 Tax=Cryptosporangium phraense TaxID=2593070 RepID=A0A545AUD5_9ACTN|nr:hypothetical protein [Cryptosporangium phraense]TQS44948.1 hypothetical protein FL583_10560 [Cryptosporangium phraense]